MIFLIFPCLFSRVEQGMRSGRRRLDLPIKMMEHFFQSFQGIDGLKNFLLFLQSQMEGYGDQVRQSPGMVNFIQRLQYFLREGLPHGEGNFKKGSNALNKGFGKDGPFLMFIDLIDIRLEIRGFPDNVLKKNS